MIQVSIRDADSRQERWIGISDLAAKLLEFLPRGRSILPTKPAPSAKAGADRARGEAVRGIKQALKVPGSVLIVEAGGSVRSLSPAPGCVLAWDADGKPFAAPISSLGGNAAPDSAAHRAESLASMPIVWWRPSGDLPVRPALLLPDRSLNGEALAHGEFVILVLLDSTSILRDGHDDAGRRMSGCVRTTIAKSGRGSGEFLRDRT